MKKQAGARGFTLLEVLVALVVMATAVTIALQLFSVNLRTVSRSGDWTAATIRADARLRDLLAEMALIETAWSETTGDGYRFDVSVVEVLKERTDNLPVKLMEISLTIHWWEGPKEKSLRVKTVKMLDKIPPAEKNLKASG